MRLLANACACGCTGGYSRLFPTRDHNFGTIDESAWVRRCAACGSLFPEVFPTADTVAEAYAAYYTQPRRRRGLRRLLRAGIDATRSEHLRRSAPAAAADILDYGCGSGEYLQLLAQTGHKARLTGTDITRPQGTDDGVFEWVALGDCDAGGRRYDWITLSHVIEHLPDPETVVRRLHACCRLQGALWISTPNAASLLIDIFKGHARDVDFPRHRQVFSRSALQRVLVEAGFQVEFAPSPRVDALMNFATCARNLRCDRSVGVVRKVTLLMGGFLRLALHLLKPSSLRALDGPEIIVVARPAPAP
jgi:hypothetical protein